MHEHPEYQQRVATEHDIAVPFVAEISEQKSALERWINKRILQLTSVRYRSFNLRMAFIVFIQGLLLEQQRAADNTPADANHPYTRKMQQRFSAMYGSLTPYAGKIIYFRCTERPPAVVDDPWSGWSKLAGENMKIHNVPGSHTALLQQPNVASLASILKQEMAAAHTVAADITAAAESPHPCQPQYVGDNA